MTTCTKPKLTARLAVLLVATATIVQPQQAAPNAGAATEPLVEAINPLLEAINTARLAQGLEPLSLNPQLREAAQAHADDMKARDYFAFMAPDGKQIEHFVEPTGYRHWLLTEKISSGNQGPAFVLDDWLLDPEGQRQTLLNPRVRDIGIGLAPTGPDEVVVTYVLAQSMADYQLAMSSSLADLSQERQQFLDQINELRAELGRPPLHQDQRLDSAATIRAETILASMGNAPVGRSLDLYRTARKAKYRVAQIAESVALGMTTPEVAIKQWLNDQKNREALMSPVYRDLGTGAAWGSTDQGWLVVWVQLYARPGH